VRQADSQVEILDIEEEDDTAYESHDSFWRKNFAAMYETPDEEIDEIRFVANDRRKDTRRMNEEVFNFLKSMYDARLTRRVTQILLKQFNIMLKSMGEREVCGSWKQLNNLIQSSVPVNQQLVVERTHVCIKECTAFRGPHLLRRTCPVCNSNRYYMFKIFMTHNMCVHVHVYTCVRVLHYIHNEFSLRNDCQYVMIFTS
jgi:hypothetical protein